MFRIKIKGEEINVQPEPKGIGGALSKIRKKLEWVNEPPWKGNEEGVAIRLRGGEVIGTAGTKERASKIVYTIVKGPDYTNRRNIPGVIKTLGRIGVQNISAYMTRGDLLDLSALYKLLGKHSAKNLMQKKAFEKLIKEKSADLRAYGLSDRYIEKITDNARKAYGNERLSTRGDVIALLAKFKRLGESSAKNSVPLKEYKKLLKSELDKFKGRYDLSERLSDKIIIQGIKAYGNERRPTRGDMLGVLARFKKMGESYGKKGATKEEYIKAVGEGVRIIAERYDISPHSRKVIIDCATNAYESSKRSYLGHKK